MTRTIKIYRTVGGRRPFTEWLENIRENRVKAKIVARIDRVAEGNLGVYRTVGHGIVELKIDFGPGYRIYSGLWGMEAVILLCGGAKSTQQKDIQLAHVYWDDW